MNKKIMFSMFLSGVITLCGVSFNLTHFEHAHNHDHIALTTHEHSHNNIVVGETNNKQHHNHTHHVTNNKSIFENNNLKLQNTYTHCKDHPDVALKHVVQEKLATCEEEGLKIEYDVCPICGSMYNLVKTPYPKHSAHLEHKVIRSEPTCTKNGYVREYDLCLDCNAVLNEKYTDIPALGHDFTDWIVDVEPTCSKKGHRYKECKRCKETIEENIEMHSHDLRVVREGISEPTCTEEGIVNVYRACRNCDYKELIGKESIPALGHDFEGWVIAKEPTCNAEGLKTNKCKRCGEIIKEEIPKNDNHKFEPKEERIEPTCTKPGKISTFEECSVCHIRKNVVETEIPVKGHHFSDYIIDVEPTCNAPGRRHKECLNEGCDEIIYEDIPALGHQMKHVINVVDPTCTTDGFKEEYDICINCEMITNRHVLETYPKLGHSFTSWIEDLAPTCTTDGLKHSICNRCKETIYEVIPKFEHEWSTWTLETPATCVEEGSECRTCLRCGEVEHRKLPALGHTFSDWEVISYPTCGIDGQKARRCTRCGEYEYDIIPATGLHTEGTPVEEEFTDATCQNEEYHYLRTYCTECGLLLNETKVITGPKLDHVLDIRYDNFGFDPETKRKVCDEITYCVVCGEVISTKQIEIPPHEHNYIESRVVLREPTCSKVGYCEVISRCSICGDEESRRIIEIPANGHPEDQVYTVVENQVFATCDSDGHYDEVRYCGLCNEEISRTTYIQSKETAHVSDEGEVVEEVKATCQQEGKIVTSFKCVKCGKEIKREVQTIPKLDHDFQLVSEENRVEPTCGKDGSYDEVYICKTCNERHVEHKIIEKTGAHNFGDWEVSIKPSCTQPGIERRICQNEGCSYIESREIPATGHQETIVVKEKISPASCEYEGSYDEVTYCKNCGFELSRVTKSISIADHSYGEFVVTREPTCHQEGEKIRTCTKCGHTEIVSIPKLNHIAGEPVVEETSKGCLQNGTITTTVRCVLCGDIISQTVETIPSYGGHKPGRTEKQDVIESTCTSKGSYVLVTYCERCGEIINKRKIETPILEHKFGEWVVTTPPTNLKDGEESRKCELCGKVETRSIPKIDGTDEFIEVVKSLSKYDDLNTSYLKIKKAYDLYSQISNKAKISSFYKDLTDFATDFFKKTSEFNKEHEASNELVLSSFSLTSAIPLLGILLLELKRFL